MSLPLPVVRRFFLSLPKQHLHTYNSEASLLYELTRGFFRLAAALFSKKFLKLVPLIVQGLFFLVGSFPVQGVLPENLKLHIVQSLLVGGPQIQLGGLSELVGLGPPLGAEAPKVPLLQTGKHILGHGRAEVVPHLGRKFQKVVGDLDADGVPPNILGSSRAIAVPVKARPNARPTNVRAAAFHLRTQHVNGFFVIVFVAGRQEESYILDWQDPGARAKLVDGGSETGHRSDPKAQTQEKELIDSHGSVQMV